MRSKIIFGIYLMLATLFISQLLTVSADSRGRQTDDNKKLLYRTDNALVLVEFGNDIVESTEIIAFEDTIKCTEWSDDGRWLIIGRESGIYRMDSQTYAVESLVDQDDIGTEESFILWCPMLSPDNQQIAFRTSQPDYTAALYAVKTDGSLLTQLVERMGLSSDWIGPVNWSYDSQWMLFYAGLEDQFGRWRVRPNTNQLEIIQQAGAEKIDDALEREMLANLSPDQQKIMFFSIDPNRNPENIPFQLIVKNEASGEILFDIEGADSFDPIWSIDSQSILLISYDFLEALYVEHFDLVSQTSELLSTNIELEFEALTGIFRPSNPIWSPDHEWVVISQTAQLLDIDSGELIDLPMLDEFSGVLWDIDSEFILYRAGAEETYGIYRYDMQTQSVSLLIPIDSSIQDLTWWPTESNP